MFGGPSSREHTVSLMEVQLTIANDESKHNHHPSLQLSRRRATTCPSCPRFVSARSGCSPACHWSEHSKHSRVPTERYSDNIRATRTHRRWPAKHHTHRPVNRWRHGQTPPSPPPQPLIAFPTPRNIAPAATCRSRRFRAHRSVPPSPTRHHVVLRRRGRDLRLDRPIRSRKRARSAPR